MHVTISNFLILTCYFRVAPWTFFSSSSQISLCLYRIAVLLHVFTFLYNRCWNHISLSLFILLNFSTWEIMMGMRKHRWKVGSLTLYYSVAFYWNFISFLASFMFATMLKRSIHSVKNRVLLGSQRSKQPRVMATKNRWTIGNYQVG